MRLLLLLLLCYNYDHDCTATASTARHICWLLVVARRSQASLWAARYCCYCCYCCYRVRNAWLWQPLAASSLRAFQTWGHGELLRSRKRGCTCIQRITEMNPTPRAWTTFAASGGFAYIAESWSKITIPGHAGRFWESFGRSCKFACPSWDKEILKRNKEHAPLLCVLRSVCNLSRPQVPRRYCSRRGSRIRRLS